MKKSKSILLTLILFIVVTMSSCEIAGDLIQFGVGVGVIVVVLVVVLIWWIIKKFKR